MKRLGKISLALLAVIVIVACSNKKGSNGENDRPSQFFPPEDLPEKFLAGEFEAIYHQTSKAFQESVSLKEFKKLGKDFTKGVNNFESVSTMPVQAFTEYQWISDAGDKGIRSYFAEDYTIEGLQVLPIHSYESDEVYTKNTYQMPMAGEWFTFWGGTNELVNYHYAVASQRYAYDLVIVENDSTFEGDPTKNESYYAFGEDVLAPYDGIVVSAENEIEYNTPTVDTNEIEPLGNHVILKHEHQEYSVIAHIQKGSLKVKEGDQVKAGDLLGSVGNSGNSSEPHIHFHVADGENWQEATSIRIKLKDGIEPVRGEKVTGF